MSSHCGEPLVDKRVVLDCRWLGIGGAGRATELLLREFQQSPPAGNWILWGDLHRLRDLSFEGAQIRPSRNRPTALVGQMDFFRVPRADVVVYMHQMRPLRPGRSVTLIHDTIPIRFGGSKASRWAKHAFFTTVGRLSTRILTVSAYSQQSIVTDLGVDPARIRVISYPLDEARAAKTRELRKSLATESVLLYVGGFGEHKNLKNLCLAFQGSAFCRDGGTLLLVGGSSVDVKQLERWMRDRRFRGIGVRPTCSEEELDRFLATSRALIIPSLEEGYGLPAFEAAACGLPVAASRTGAMRDLPDHVALLFDPTRLEAIQEAIDAITKREVGVGLSCWPTSFAAPLIASLTECLTA